MKKRYNKSLLELDHALELSYVGASASCYAASYHGTKEYARQAVAQHRSISAEIRESLAYLIRNLDNYDALVEEAHQKLLMEKIYHE
jgi:hypothetical protein